MGWRGANSPKLFQKIMYFWKTITIIYYLIETLRRRERKEKKTLSTFTIFLIRSFSSILLIKKFPKRGNEYFFLLSTVLDYKLFGKSFPTIQRRDKIQCGLPLEIETKAFVIHTTMIRKFQIPRLSHSSIGIRSCSANIYYNFWGRLSGYSYTYVAS